MRRARDEGRAGGESDDSKSFHKRTSNQIPRP